MERILGNNKLALALSILGVMYPMQFNKEVLALSNPAHAVVPFNWNSVVSAVVPMVHRAVKSNALRVNSRAYTYTFTGKATFEGLPLANARVEIRVTSDSAADIHEVITDPNGRYTLSVPVTGNESETLSWEIRGLTSDLKQAHLEGHQILTHEHTVKMVAPLHFSEN
jgi:hypothetical protein